MQKENPLCEAFIEGKVLFIDKPYQWTSFDVVNKVKSMLRYVLGIKKIKVGHAGTLDPLATGLLIVCTGKATRRISSFQELNKTYTGTFFLGQTTPSYDLETAADKEYDTGHITEQLLKETAETFIGEQEQVPPLFSAKKINGKRAYEHARQGSETVLKAQKVNIESFEITKATLPEIEFRVICSKGTYIRSLARDFGERLGSGAYLKSLKRTHIGNYSLHDAVTLNLLESSIRESAK